MFRILKGNGDASHDGQASRVDRTYAIAFADHDVTTIKINRTFGSPAFHLAHRGDEARFYADDLGKAYDDFRPEVAFLCETDKSKEQKHSLYLFKALVYESVLKDNDTDQAAKMKTLCAEAKESFLAKHGLASFQHVVGWSEYGLGQLGRFGLV